MRLGLLHRAIHDAGGNQRTWVQGFHASRVIALCSRVATGNSGPAQGQSKTFAQALGPDFDNATRDAWRHALEAISRAMKATAEDPQ